MRNRGGKRGWKTEKKKNAHIFVCRPCTCVRSYVRVCSACVRAGRATLNRTCVVCGRIHFSLVPETNPVHTNKDDVIYQRFPVALLILIVHRLPHCC